MNTILPPKKIRHHGEQYHHNHPSPLTDQLYLAAARAISSRVLLDLGITHIINATLELPTMAYQKQDAIQIAVEDRVASKLYVYFDLVADKIHSVHESDTGKAMIYCRAGMSRSASLCIAYFIKYHDMSLDDAFQYVKQRRPIISPNVGFMRQLREYEQKLRRNKNGGDKNEAEYKQLQLPALTFARECCSSQDDEHHYDDYYSGIKIIKPRPSPKQPKILFSEVMDLSAQTYSITVVELCDEMSARGVDLQSVRAEGPSLGVKEPLVLPDVRCPQALENLGATSAITTTTTEGTKRVPFSKISEPGKIAVSYQPPLALEEAEASTSSTVLTPFSVASFSVFADVHLSLPAVTEALALERVWPLRDERGCSLKPGQQPVPKQPHEALVSSQPTRIRKGLRDEAQAIRPGLVLRLSHAAIVAGGAEEVLERHGEFRKQQVAPMPFPSRTASTRVSIKLPGLKISPVPEKIKKDPIIETNGAEYLTTASSSEAFVCENTEDNMLRPYLLKLRQPYCSMHYSEASHVTENADVESEAFELVVRDPHCSLKLAWLLSVARKTAIQCHGLETLNQQELNLEGELPVSTYMPGKEYTYYSLIKKDPVPLTAVLTAKENPAIEANWFFALSPRKSTKSVCLVHKNESIKPKKEEDLQIRWAKESYQVDLAATHACKELLLPERARAEIKYPGRLAVQVVDQDAFVTIATEMITKMKTQSYSSFSVANMCSYPLLVVAIEDKMEPLEMNNMYCEPTSFTEHCVETFEARAVAIIESVSVQDDSSDLVEIPDVVDDLNELKRRLMAQNDPIKVAIWLDVFKRRVINARPIHPFVRMQEVLMVAEVEELNVECLVREEYLDTVEVREQPLVGKECHYFNAIQVLEVRIEEANDDFYDECYAYSSVEEVIHTQMVSGVQLCYEPPLFEDHYLSSNTRPKDLPTYANSRLTMMMTVASSEAQAIQGTTLKKTYIPTVWMERRPFQLLTSFFLELSLGMISQMMWHEAEIPNFQYIQDIEDSAECGFHVQTESAMKAEEATVDVLLFFELNPEPIRSLTPEPLPNFQLFLPDPEAAGKLLPPVLSEEEAERLLPVDDSKLSIPELKKPRDFLKRAQSMRTSRPKLEKRVSFRSEDSDEDPPPSVVKNRLLDRSVLSFDSSEQSSSYSCQVAPRARSLSRKRVDTSVILPGTRTDRQTMANLRASVKQASDLLDRRKSEGARRSREVTRSYGTSTANESSIKGFLDKAQSWIMPRSREREHGQMKTSGPVRSRSGSRKSRRSNY